MQSWVAFWSYTRDTNGMLEAKFDLISTTPGPNNRNVKFVFREICKFPYENLASYGKFFLS